MASSSSSSSLLILAVACLVSLISPAIAQTCSSPFETCLDLPTLDTSLHYTYNASNSSLSVAFIATPSSSSGWVAWAINPTATGMLGSQAFVAYRSGAGAAPVVKMYNISSYKSSRIVEGRLAFDFWNLRVESMSENRIAIYTTVKVPAGADKVNQVWQIGGDVTNDRIGGHPILPANLNSKAELRFTGDGRSSAPGSAPGSAPAPKTGGSTTPGQAAGGPGNAGSMATSVNFGVNLGILVLLGSIFIL